MLPKSEERKKYQKRTLTESSERASKRARTEQRVQDPTPLTVEDDTESSLPPPKTPQEANERFINANLTVEKAIYLIFTNIPKLPLSMPASFNKDYSKYVLSGRIGKSYLAEALATQFVEAKVGPGVDIKVEEKPQVPKRKREPEEAKVEEEKVCICYIFNFLYIIFELFLGAQEGKTQTAQNEISKTCGNY